MKRIIALTLVLGMAASCLVGCGGVPSSPLPGLLASLKDVPTFSIVLADMKREGNFSDSYYQKFKILTPQAKPAAQNSSSTDADGVLFQPSAVSATQTDWVEVSERWYKENERFLGMTIYAKKDGAVQKTAGPAGYEYVGDSRYGRWTNDSHGNRIWCFFGQYALFSMMMGNRGVYHRDYSDYRTSQGRGGAYYGPKDSGGRPTYGTSGSVTQRQNPNFYARRMAVKRAASSSFSKKVSSRTGRSSVGVRSRSGRAGK